jgi:hypothetical protein
MIRRIRQDDPTPPMVPVFQPPAPVPLPASGNRDLRRGDRRRQHAKSRAVVISRITIVLVGLVLAGYFLLVPERFELRNQLQVPIEVSANDGSSQVIQPGGRFLMDVPDDHQVLARWFVVQPSLDGEEPAGDPTSGIVRIESITLPEILARRVSRSVDPWMTGGVLFAPRITNTTDNPLRVIINNRPGDAACNCTVRPHATQLLGYFHLRDSSSVRVEDDLGRAVGFTGLEARIDAESGVLDLTIDDTVLSRSPSP